MNQAPPPYTFTLPNARGARVIRNQQQDVYERDEFDPDPYDAAARLMKDRVRRAARMSPARRHFLAAATSFLAIILTLSGIIMTCLGYSYVDPDKVSHHKDNPAQVTTPRTYLSSPAEAAFMTVMGPLVLSVGILLVICIYVCFVVVQAKRESFRRSNAVHPASVSTVSSLTTQPPVTSSLTRDMRALLAYRQDTEPATNAPTSTDVQQSTPNATPPRLEARRLRPELSLQINTSNYFSSMINSPDYNRPAPPYSPRYTGPGADTPTCHTSCRRSSNFTPYLSRQSAITEVA